MSILIGSETRLVVQGLTGKEGSFHAGRNTATHPNAGLHVLAINDLKVTDNAGAFDVDIKVTPGRAAVVERFRDELGDWRVCVLTPFGARVHAPWALALGARLRDALGLQAQSIWSDDGIILRLGEAYDHVRLLKPDGRPDKRAFLEIGEELWDHTGTRLTLLFDPGRVKRGIRPNLELGRAMVAGRRYAIVVDADWRDAHGHPLQTTFRHAFTAAPEETRVTGLAHAFPLVTGSPEEKGAADAARPRDT